MSFVGQGQSCRQGSRHGRENLPPLWLRTECGRGAGVSGGCVLPREGLAHCPPALAHGPAPPVTGPPQPSLGLTHAGRDGCAHRGLVECLCVPDPQQALGKSTVNRHQRRSDKKQRFLLIPPIRLWAFPRGFAASPEAPWRLWALVQWKVSFHPLNETLKHSGMEFPAKAAINSRSILTNVSRSWRPLLPGAGLF